jgi:hypothetical protein
VADFLVEIKRLTGRRFCHKSVQQDIKLWPFKVAVGHEDRPMVLVDGLRGGGVHIAAIRLPHVATTDPNTSPQVGPPRGEAEAKAAANRAWAE